MYTLQIVLPLCEVKKGCIMAAITPGDLSIDIELAQRIKARDLQAYRVLIDRYYPFIYTVAYALHRDDDVANQYVMDVLSHAWNHADALRFKGSLRPYFFQLIYAKYQRYLSFFPTVKEII